MLPSSPLGVARKCVSTVFLKGYLPATAAFILTGYFVQQSCPFTVYGNIQVGLVSPLSLCSFPFPFSLDVTSFLTALTGMCPSSASSLFSKPLHSFPETAEKSPPRLPALLFFVSPSCSVPLLIYHRAFFIDLLSAVEFIYLTPGREWLKGS